MKIDTSVNDTVNYSSIHKWISIHKRINAQQVSEVRFN